jgi:hypothetical protein
MEVGVNPLLIAALLVLLLTVPAPAQVRVDIGIHLPSPPSLVIVPGTPVYYAPQAPANVFLYGHQYWAFNNGGWYTGPNWTGPWVVVEPAVVPVPVLRVPVRYYPAPPGHWRGWAPGAPPRWEKHYGRGWHESASERNWREREEHWDRDKHKGHDGDRGKGHDKK